MTRPDSNDALRLYEVINDLDHRGRAFEEGVLSFRISDAEYKVLRTAARASLPSTTAPQNFDAIRDAIAARMGGHTIPADWSKAWGTFLHLLRDVKASECAVSETPRGDTAKISAMVEALSARKMQLFYKLADENCGELLAALRSNGGSAKVPEGWRREIEDLLHAISVLFAIQPAGDCLAERHPSEDNDAYRAFVYLNDQVARVKAMLAASPSSQEKKDA